MRQGSISSLHPRLRLRKGCIMFIAWTTLPTKAEAEQLASDTIARGLAVCAQVEGPIISHYRWQGSQERTEEYRIMFKLLPDKLPHLEKHVLSQHPYDTPEWIAIKADQVGEKYLSWASASPTNLTL
ncbi:MAG: CutA1 divalent ion tolerance protein [Verrucomicrobia bacterium]|nr:CutA1 divalent ion tolerance protein [Verrucomicrobiota bacterium]